MEQFWKTCEACKGTGEVSHLSKLASKNYPTGSIVADRKHSYCGACHGAGIVVKSEGNMRS